MVVQNPPTETQCVFLLRIGPRPSHTTTVFLLHYHKTQVFKHFLSFYGFKAAFCQKNMYNKLVLTLFVSIELTVGFDKYDLLFVSLRAC